MLALVVVSPVIAAAMSPLLAWRQPVYIIAGFAGVLAMIFLLIQPLLAGGYLPGLTGRRARLIHRIVGGTLVLAILIHVGGLWITSPPDVIDALLFVSPTPFSVWGVIGMWALFLTAFLAAFRHRLRLRPDFWRLAHTGLAIVIVVASVVHALLIEGTMEIYTKIILCVLALVATAKTIFDLKVWVVRTRRRG